MKFIFKRWSSIPPSFPVEKPPGQTVLILHCPVCELEIYFGAKRDMLEDVHCLSSPATCARARGVRTRGNDD